MINLKTSNFFDDDNYQKKINEKYKSNIKKINTKLFSKDSLLTLNINWINNFISNENYLNELNQLSSTWKKNEKINTIIIITNGLPYFALKAMVDMCKPLIDVNKEIIFISNISTYKMTNLINKLKKNDFYLLVFSKDGNTFEVNLAFRLIFDLLFQKFGSELLKDKILLMTKSNDNGLRKIINKFGLKSFVYDDEILDELSLISPIGFLMFNYLGLNLNNFINGIQLALKDIKVSSVSKNSAYQYAICKYIATKEFDKKFELYTLYDEQLIGLGNYLKQLSIHLFDPKAKLFLSNYHLSNEQYINNNLIPSFVDKHFTTILRYQKPIIDINIDPFLDNIDNLNYVDNKSLFEINNTTIDSIVDYYSNQLNLKVLEISIPVNDEFNFGYFYIWFYFAMLVYGQLNHLNVWKNKNNNILEKKISLKRIAILKGEKK